MRLRPKSSLVIFNNAGGEFQTTLIAITKRQAVVLPQKFNQCNNESPLQIHLGQAISRGEKMDFTIQKAVELGVYAITPLFTEHCNVKLSGEHLEKNCVIGKRLQLALRNNPGAVMFPRFYQYKI